jgi:hypothetical protein
MAKKFVEPSSLPMRGIGTDIFQGHRNIVGFQKNVYCPVIKNMRLPFVSFASPNDTDEESTVVYNRATRSAVTTLQGNDSTKASVTWGGQLDRGVHFRQKRIGRVFNHAATYIPLTTFEA